MGLITTNNLALLMNTIQWSGTIKAARLLTLFLAGLPVRGNYPEAPES